MEVVVIHSVQEDVKQFIQSMNLAFTKFCGRGSAEVLVSATHRPLPISPDHDGM
jgi:hypothetical protein